MIYTTLNKIRTCHPCEDGWRTLLAGLNKTAADDEPLGFDTILASNGLDDTLWCCRSVPEHGKTWRLFSVWCARQVQHLMTDPRSIAALDVAEAHAYGRATDAELAAEVAAARAAWAAAGDAAWAAAGDAAGAAAVAAARTAAWAAARTSQQTQFLKMIGDENGQ